MGRTFHGGVINPRTRRDGLVEIREINGQMGSVGLNDKVLCL